MSIYRTWFAALAALVYLVITGCGCGSLQQEGVSNYVGKGDTASEGYELDIAALQRGVKEKSKNPASSKWYHLTWQKLSSDDWRDLFRMKTLVANPPIDAPSHLFGQFGGAQDNWTPFADQGLITDGTNADVFVSNGQGGLTQIPGLKGDAELVKVLCRDASGAIAPGAIGVSLKHEKPKDILLDVAAAAQNEKQNKEMMKLYDHHIQMWVCLDDGQGNVRLITLNNPTNYSKDNQALDGSGFNQQAVYGGIGTRGYNNVFLRFDYGELQSQPALAKAFNDNIRSWAMIFNSISWFPSDYDGNDPLRSYSPQAVREHAAMAVHAVVNTPGARSWWLDKLENYLYCAEFAYLAAAAGLDVPLNETSIVGLAAPDGFPTITKATWDKFKSSLLTGEARVTPTYIDRVNRTNAGRDAPRNGGMRNTLRKGVLQLIPLDEAPTDLQPFKSYLSDQARAAAGCGQGDDKAACLAFNPMTSADMVRYFLATFVPRYPVYQMPAGPERDAAMQGIGQVQAQLLFGMREGLFQAVIDERMPAQAQQQVREKIYQLIGGITGCVDADNDGVLDQPFCGDSVLTRSYPTYEGFVAAVNADPYFLGAQQLVTQGATPYFTPPSLFHVAANGWHNGLLGMKYVTHGFHFSVVKPKGTFTPPVVQPGTTVATKLYGCKNLSSRNGDANYPALDKQGMPWQDYSMHMCVDINEPGFAQSDCAGKTVVGYCAGSSAKKCCVK